LFNIIIISIYTPPQIRAPNYIKQTVADLKGKIKSKVPTTTYEASTILISEPKTTKNKTADQYN
jgi:hypothetical protein